MSRGRRRFLAGAVLPAILAVAGCQDGASEDPTPTEGTSSDTATTEPSRSPDVLDLDETCVASEFNGYTGTTPVPPPSGPSPLSGDSALAFTTEYERYYQRYEALYEVGPPTPEREDEPAHGFPAVRFRDERTEVIEESSAGWITRMAYDLHYEYSRDGEFREMGPRTATYYVSDELTIRASVADSVDSGPDPLEEGTIMRC